MTQLKNTYRYHFKINGDVVESGTALDLEQVEIRLRDKYNGGKIFQIGKVTTHDAATEWLYLYNNVLKKGSKTTAFGIEYDEDGIAKVPLPMPH